jgi:hypothetical protein
VEGVPRRDVGVAEEAVHEVGPHPARRCGTMWVWHDEWLVRLAKNT